ncbi:MAG: transglutaminase domain-containing protein [Candidatus Micrarchaeota archaeon]|nr:transglutaminase domain-containing protein [Candidatus Micrarchaeota archaeon]
MEKKNRYVFIFVTIIAAILVFIILSENYYYSSGTGEHEESGYQYLNESKIIHYAGNEKVVIRDSVLMGVYAHDNANITIENSTIYRIAVYDNATINVVKSKIAYLNDHYPLIENITKVIFLNKSNSTYGGTLSDNEKVLMLYRWARDKITFNKTPTYGMAHLQNFNVTKILKYMDGDCGAHAAVLGALAHYAGYPSRFIEAKNHMVSEVFYNGKWHMFDSDPKTNDGKYYVDENGTILNCYDLFENPSLYDRDFFHVWDPKNTRFFDVGHGQLSIDGFQYFLSLNMENKNKFRELFYDNAWLYLPKIS